MLALVLGSLATVLVSRDAHAYDTATCTRMYENAQSLALDGHLVDARAEYARCVDASCPSLVRQDCSKKHEETEARVPSVIFAVRTAEGADVVDVTVEIDGKVVSSTLTGKAIDLDPGHHQVRLTRGGVTDTFDLLAREGEKLRSVVRPGTPAPPAPPAAPDPDAARPVPWTVFALGGLGVVGLATGTILGVRGYDTYKDYDGSCGHACTDAQADEVRSQLLVADVFLAVGVVAAVAAVWIFVDSRSGGSPAAPTTRRPGAFAF